MTMLHYLKTVVIGGATVCAAGFGSPAFAQTSQPPQELPLRVTPGWAFTPTIAISAAHDDNPVLAGRGDPSPSDVITNVRPGGELTFTSKHAFFGGGYRGSIQRYRELDQYDSYDQGGYVEYRQKASRRVSLFVRDNFSVSPTTDLVEVAGVPFTRTGTRQNDFNGGLTTAITKTVEITGSYHFQWIEFDNPDPLSPVLHGGRSHSASIGAHKALSSRLTLGGRYGLQRASIGPSSGTTGDFDIQDAEGTAEFELRPSVKVDGGFGIARVVLPGPNGTRTGPAGHVSIRKVTEHAQFTLGAMRSFVPNYGFGGSIRNQQVIGSVRVPFARNRAYSAASVAWRKSQPVLVNELGLQAVWVMTTVGYAFQRWVALEGFYNGAFQASTVAGGRVDRNRVGVQIVTSRPMRLK